MTGQAEISIHGQQSDGQGWSDSSQLQAMAQYYYRNGCHYLLYEETQEGFRESVHSRIQLREGRLELVKTGAVNTRMTLEPGLRCKNDYHMPYGTMVLETDTKRLEIREEEDRIQAEAEYILWADGAYLSDCHIRIDIKKTSQ